MASSFGLLRDVASVDGNMLVKCVWTNFWLVWMFILSLLLMAILFLVLIAYILFANFELKESDENNEDYTENNFDLSNEADQTESEEFSFYKAKYGDSWYAAKELDNSKTSGVLPPGQFPVLAWTKEGEGRVDWFAGTRILYEPYPPERILGNGDNKLKESFLVAELYCSNNRDVLGINYKRDVSVHVWPSERKKGGFSGGCALALSIISTCKNKGLKSGFAILGELAEDGKIVEVDGTAEKIAAAKQIGIANVLAPNEMEKILNPIKDEINIIYVSNILEALPYLEE